MYQEYFGLAESPFSIAVNPRYLFMSQRHREALAHLLYGVGTGGFILLTGEVGTGKTTLTRCLLEQLPEGTDVAIVLNPALDALELLAAVCDELGIRHRGHGSTLKELTDSLHRFLLDNHARGRRTVLLIDEAQHLGHAVLEQIRLLTNLETHDEKLLQIILVGQPELAVLLQRPELRQLNQRITARFNLTPLDRRETRSYIRHRLEVAGLPADRELFPPGVAARVHRLTGGIPRLINLLCDRVLLGAYGRGEPRASGRLLNQAAREVLGTQPPRRHWRWAAAFTGAVLLVLSLVWLMGRTAPPELEDSVATAPREAPAAAPLPEPGPAASGTSPVAREAVAVAAADTVAASAATGESWLLAPGEALQRLWRAVVPVTEVAVPPPGLDRLCEATQVTHPLSCLRAQAESWGPLRDRARPLLLELRTPQGFLATGLWLGATRTEALLWGGGAMQRIPLERLAAHWTGIYWLLWRPPEGFREPLGPGSSGETVAAIARGFAELDGQASPLADRVYSPALEQRVRLFQEAQGLQSDGWSGVQTLMRLDESLQAEVSVEEWAERLASAGGEA